MNKREIYYDVLRIIAILAVITIHVTAEVWYSDTISNYWLINNFINAFVHSWAVPLFIAITGALLLKKDIDIKKVFLKYIPRVLICLIVWHYIYYFALDRTFTFESLKIATHNLLIGKAFSHLWYLYLIIGIYILIPILCKLVQNLDKKKLLYLISILFIITILIPNIDMLTDLDLSIYVTPFKVFTLNEYILFLLLGYYLNTYEFKNKKVIIIISIISLLLLITNAWYGNHLSIINNAPMNFAKTNTVVSVLMVISLFLLAKTYLKGSNKGQKFITTIGELTFGTYLVHFLVIKVLTKFGLTANFINPIFGSIIIIMLVAIISYLISYLISKIPYVKKVIGL